MACGVWASQLGSQTSPYAWYILEERWLSFGNHSFTQHLHSCEGVRRRSKVPRTKEKRRRLGCAHSWARLHGEDAFDSVVGEGREQERPAVG